MQPTLSEIIKALRKAGWSYRRIADYVGVDSRSILRWEKEGKFPRYGDTETRLYNLYRNLGETWLT